MYTQDIETAIVVISSEATQLLVKNKIDNIPTQGQALAAASLPVVLTAIQVTALTPPAAISGFNLEATQTAMSAKLPATLGQKAMAASMAVVLASDQASVPVASTLTAETTKVIGTVNIAAAQTVATVTTVSTVTNLSQMGGVAISLNTGVRDTGTQRVTIATNDVVPVTGTITAVTAITNALPVGANVIGKVSIDQATPGTTNLVALTAETTKVIGTINVSAKTTYRASTIIPLVAAVTVNVPFFNIIGSATKTVTVKRITVSGMTLTAVGYFAINVEKLSTATSAGTSTTLVATTLDTANAAVTAVVKAYTVAPTKGALVGTIASWRALWQSTTAAAGGMTNYYDFTFGGVAGSGGVVLRGTAQELALVFPVVLASAGTLSVSVEWTEE